MRVETGANRDENQDWNLKRAPLIGLALPAHPDSSILTGRLKMTWWGAEYGMGSSFESLRMSGLEWQTGVLISRE